MVAADLAARPFKGMRRTPLKARNARASRSGLPGRDEQIENMIAGDQNARSEAQTSVRKLGSLMKKAGGRNLLEKWDDRALTSLNIDISNAHAHHQACMMVAGQLFGRAPLGDEKYRDAAKSECRAYRRSYEEASRAYRYLR